MGVMEARRRILLNQPHLIDASGNPISFSTDMAAKMGVKAYFSPVQSGSGDPSPSNVRPISGWTGCEVHRTGANLFNPANCLESTTIDTVNEKVASHGTYNLYVVPVKQNTDYAFTQIQPIDGYPVFGLTDVYPETDTHVYSISSIRYYGKYTFNSGSHNYAIFAEYKTAGTSFAVALGSTGISYTTPYSGSSYPVTFPAVGINQWNEQCEQGALDSNTGQPASSLVQIRSKDFIPVKAGETYYGYCGALAGQASNTMVVNYYDSNQNFVAYGGGINGTTKTIPTGVSYMKFWTGTAYGNTYLNDISINYPSTDTAYHAYDNTIYGGYVDYERGEVVATHVCSTVDGDESFRNTINVFNNIARFQIDPGNYGPIPYGNVDVIFNYLTRDADFASEWSGFINASTRRLQLYVPATFDTIEKISEYLSQNPLQVFYKITPISYSLTPTLIKSLKGANTIWSDANGNVDIKYWKH